MKGMASKQTALWLINQFYDETTIDVSLSDTSESAGLKIIEDFEFAKRLALKCNEILKVEHTFEYPISWNTQRLKFHEFVGQCIKKIEFEEFIKLTS